MSCCRELPSGSTGSARYLERAETTSRLARVYGNLLLDLPRQARLGWDGLIEITGGATLYRELYPKPDGRHARTFLRGGPQ